MVVLICEIHYLVNAQGLLGNTMDLCSKAKFALSRNIANFRGFHNQHSLKSHEFRHSTLILHIHQVKVPATSCSKTV